MKKLLYSVASVVTMAFAMTSCSNAVDEPAVGDGDVEVQLTATVAGNVSRAVADGENVDQISYAIYRQDKDGAGTTVTGPLALYGDTDVQKTDAMSGGKYSLTVSLARNEVYTVVFWADKKVTGENAKQPYTFDATNKKITIDYDGALANDDSRDAFYGVATINAGVDVAPTVELRRRFTLVNLLTNDTEKYITASAATKVEKSYIKVSKAAKELNLLDGSVASDVENVTFAINALPTDESPMTDYSYLAYALVASPQGTLADVSYGVADGVALNTINNVPLKQNYRTNIYGSLLTSTTNITTEVKPDTDGTDELEVWDGVSSTTPTIDEENHTITVSTPSEFIGLLDLLNGTTGAEAVMSRATTTDYLTYSVKLTADIDFGGYQIPMVGKATRSSGTASGKIYSGVLDGNDHTLKNFVISDDSSANLGVGFISCISGADAGLKNIKFENVKISSTKSEQVGVVGMILNGATVENVEVVSGSVSGAESAGGVVARILANGYVKGCSNGASVYGTKNVGGVVGAAYYQAEGLPMSVVDCSNSGAIKADGDGIAGGVVGFACCDVKRCTNSGTVTGTEGDYFGGVIGLKAVTGSVEDCENTGDVYFYPIEKANAKGHKYGAGGIIGGINYYNVYDIMSISKVLRCANSGNIYSKAYGVGGIVGICFHWGVVEGCTNTSKHIEGDKNVSGIVGIFTLDGMRDHLSENKAEWGDYNLVLKQNNSTTTKEQMTYTKNSAPLVWINTDDIDKVTVTFEGNTPESNEWSTED